MSLDPLEASKTVGTLVLASGGLLAWVSRFAESRGRRFKEKQDSNAETRVDRNEIIAWQKGEMERLQAERAVDRAEIVALRGERDAMDVARRSARDKLRTTDDLNDDLMRWGHRATVYMEQAHSLLVLDEPEYPKPPPMPDPAPAKDAAG